MHWLFESKRLLVNQLLADNIYSRESVPKTVLHPDPPPGGFFYACGSVNKPKKPFLEPTLEQWLSRDWKQKVTKRDAEDDRHAELASWFDVWLEIMGGKERRR